jgi:hypothetical protein
MKASELILQLQQLIKDHGDWDVYIKGPDDRFEEIKFYEAGDYYNKPCFRME